MLLSSSSSGINETVYLVGKKESCVFSLRLFHAL
jgi:hypothetical protein